MDRKKIDMAFLDLAVSFEITEEEYWDFALESCLPEEEARIRAILERSPQARRTLELIRAEIAPPPAVNPFDGNRGWEFLTALRKEDRALITAPDTDPTARAEAIERLSAYPLEVFRILGTLRRLIDSPIAEIKAAADRAVKQLQTWAQRTYGVRSLLGSVDLSGVRLPSPSPLQFAAETQLADSDPNPVMGLPEGISGVLNFIPREPGAFMLSIRLKGALSVDTEVIAALFVHDEGTERRRDRSVLLPVIADVYKVILFRDEPLLAEELATGFCVIGISTAEHID